MKYPITVGVLLRRNFRAMMDVQEITYTEYRGFLESTFVLNVSSEQRDKIHEWIERINQRV